MVLLKNAFIAQTQPPRDALLVLEHITNQRKVLHVSGTHKVKEKERKTERHSTNKLYGIFQWQTACLQVQPEQKCVRFMYVFLKKRRGRVVKLYLYSVVMHSICGQRLYNAHVTVRSTKMWKKCKITANTAFHRMNKKQIHTHKNVLTLQ